MVGRIKRAVLTVGSALREIGSGMRGTMPPMQSSDGTFGTQRMQARDRAAERRETYPGS